MDSWQSWGGAGWGSGDWWGICRREWGESSHTGWGSGCGVSSDSILCKGRIVRLRPASDPADSDTPTSSQYDEWRKEEDVARKWIQVVLKIIDYKKECVLRNWKLFCKKIIFKTWKRQAAVVLRWLDRSLPLLGTWDEEDEVE